MEPFTRDQLELADAVRRVVGGERVEELSFYDCPTRGVFSDLDETRRPYRPPDARVPALVLSDLGIGGAADQVGRSPVSEWLAFAAALRRRDSEVIALVPYPEGRWPEALRAGITMISWDRATTVAQVLNVLRPGTASR